LNTYDEKLSKKAAEDLENMGIDLVFNTFVTEVNEKGVQIGDRFVETANVIWAAGNSASPLIKTLDTEIDKFGRAIVNPDCSIPGSKNIFVIGDAAKMTGENGRELPGVAPVAVQQGRFTADLIIDEIKGRERKAFKYLDKGSMATIGRAKAVMESGKIKASGFIAWLAWSFVHIFFLISFRNRYKVMAEWIWYYFSYRHGIRLITHRAKI
jgi:NADH dehydrogenase